MKLIEQYLSAGKRNHDHDRPPGEIRLRKARVLKFLTHCEVCGVRSLEGIQHEHYASFIQELFRSGRSTWTIYRYQMALQEFCRRRRLRFRVHPSLGKRRERQIRKIESHLDRITDLSPVLRQEIIQALRRVQWR